MTDSKHTAKRDALLKAALQLFVERGFHATPTSLISKTAGVATGTLFHHFPDKETLINTLYLEQKSRIATALRPQIPSEVDVRSQFEAIWRGAITWSLENQTSVQFLLQFTHSPFITQVTQTQAQELFNFADRVIDQGIEEGILKEISQELRHCIFGGTLQELIKLLLTLDPDAHEPLIARSFEVVWDGICHH